jgi:hypothetical protein
VTLLARRLSLVLIALSLSAGAPSPAAAQLLDIAGPYGNADGCKYVRDGQMSGDDVFLLRPDGFETYGTACEFVQVLAAKDGTKVVTGLCQNEGEDGFGTHSFIVRKSQKDVSALTIYNSDGSLYGEVSPCP